MEGTENKTRLISITAAVIGAVIGSVVVHAYFNQAPGIDKELVKITSEMNKTLPMMVDKETRLDTTSTAPNNSIVYHYTFVNLSASEIQKDVLVKTLRPQIVTSYKTNDGMKTFRDQGVTMHYSYSDRSGVFLAEIVVSPKDF